MEFSLEAIPKEVEDLVKEFSDPGLRVNLRMGADFYNRVGYLPPWIGYLVWNGPDVVGNAGFKGPPIQGKVEIAYGIFDQFQHQGFGTKAAKALVELAKKADPSVTICARTLPENNFSNQILNKNGFIFSGTVQDPEDGEVWEWVYQVP